jgi:hypothetical protein
VTLGLQERCFFIELVSFQLPFAIKTVSGLKLLYSEINLSFGRTVNCLNFGHPISLISYLNITKAIV